MSTRTIRKPDERDLDRVVVEPKFHADQSGETACRIHVLNRRISTKQELYATLLLPDYQIHRHIKLTIDKPIRASLTLMIYWAGGCG